MANQNLFNLMSQEHGITLLETEIQDIKDAIELDRIEDSVERLMRGLDNLRKRAKEVPIE
jgi:queuine/archaeosine tRNA-ribosyltransferase